MPGPWHKNALPARPGGYTNFQVAQRDRPNVPLDGIVALPFTHDWGPFETVVESDSLSEWQDVFGSSRDTPGYRAVYQAFKGEGYDGLGGAARVVSYRAGSSSAAKASKELGNVTPASPALTVTALYEGTRGNDLRVAVEANAADSATKNDLVIFDGSVELERYPHTKADISELAAEVNAKSNWVSAEADVDNVALVVGGVNAVANLTGGNDGDTLIAADWTAARTALEAKRFGVVVPYDLTDSSVLASFKTWVSDPVTGLNVRGKRCELVVGGGTIADADTMTEALTRADTLANENIVTVGGFIAEDSQILDANDDPVILTPSTLAPRIAGILAARGAKAPLTYARLADVTLRTGATESEIIQSLTGGVVTLAEDSHSQAPVRVELGVTTYQDDTATKPLEIYGNAKFVMAMHVIERWIQKFCEENVVGRLRVNDSAREYAVAAAQGFLDSLVREQVVRPGAVARVSSDPAPSDDDNFIAIDYEVEFARDVEKVLNTVIVS